MKPEDIVMVALTAIIVCGFGLIAVAFMFAPPSPANKDVTLMVLSSLATGYGSVVTYWFSRKGNPPS